MTAVLLLIAGFVVLCAVCYFFIVNRHDDDDDDKPQPEPEPQPDPEPEPEPDPDPEPEPEPVKKELGSDFEYSASTVTSDAEGELVDAPTLINTFDVAVIYSSSSEEVATVSSDGTVTVIANGETTISAEFEGDENYNPKTTSYALSVAIPEREPEEIINTLDKLLEDSFNPIINVGKETKTYEYLHQLVAEAYYQYFRLESANDLPILCKEENFPNIYNFYGTTKDEDKAFMVMTGWLCAMQLSELCPKLRNKIYKAGYIASGYNRKTPFYGFEFRSDPNVMRLTASGIYAALRSVLNPDIDAMRQELGGTIYDKTLKKILEDESRTDVKDDDFYVDLREFMATAPGPYDPSYSDRSGIKSPISDEKCSNKNLEIDQKIYDFVIENFNLNSKDEKYFQMTVQAIADKDANVKHLFGTDKRNVDGKYDFNAVFGEASIGRVLPYDNEFADFVYDTLRTGGNARGILQFADKPSVGANQYGRMRPGCSEKQCAKRKSYTDDRLNVLVDFIIEDNDGNKETYWDGSKEAYYYDEQGHWTNAKVQSPEDYNNIEKDELWANSYPSGHSSSIWSGAMTMMEIFPELTDKIMREANLFAVNRTIARYHWTSDTIQGRVIGSVINPIAHAVKDFKERLEKSKSLVR